MSLLDEALAWHRHGYAPLPVTPNGRKQPAVNWREFTADPPTADEVRGLFARVDTDGVGLICGAASGNLEMLEVEGRAAHLAAAIAERLADNGLADLWARVDAGYVEQTPSGGVHWHYRVDGPARGNTKLARRPATDDELLASPGEKVKVLVETRGEGGFTVVAPSAGRTHESGRPWTVLRGSIDTIPTVSVDERDQLHAVCAMLDQTPVADPWQPAADDDGRAYTPGTRPGDDFNERASWDDILTPHGWTRGRPFAGGGCRWVRPGKTERQGISATTGTSHDGADRLFVFSTSTVFDTERPYSKFAAYAVLEHGGDFALAAKQLAADGYGTESEQLRDPGPALTLVAGTMPVPEATSPAAAVVVDEPETYTRTDDGNALRLVDAHAHEIRYCYDWGAWLAWDGHRWRRDTHGRVDEYARAIARRLPARDPAERKHRSWTLSARGLAAMTRVARTDPRITVGVARLDAAAYELNTPAGVVDLRTGQMRSPDPAALHTRSTTLSPDFAAPPTRWLKFLAETFAGDPDLADYVQRLIGLSMIGEAPEAVMPFGWGSGANGKSTLLNVAQHALGIGDDGYAMPVPAELLLAASNRSHPTEIAQLSGARLVVASELEEGEKFAEARIKLLTGKDNLRARFMGRDYFSFKPTHTIWLLANEQPSVRAGGPAFWRRIRMIPFQHVVPPEQRVNGLDDQLIEHEGPQILAWMIAGCVDYLRHGLNTPPAVADATARYEQDQDHLGRFADECCVIGDPNAAHMKVAVGKLRARYEQWCRTEGETPISPRALTMQLRNRFGVESGRDRAARYYAGVTVADGPQASHDPVPPDALDDDEPWWQR